MAHWKVKKMPEGKLLKSASIHSADLTWFNAWSSDIHCNLKKKKKSRASSCLCIKLQASKEIIMGTSSAVNLQCIQYPGISLCVHILSHGKCEVVQGSLFLDENRVNPIYSEIKACAYVDRYDRGTRRY